MTEIFDMIEEIKNFKPFQHLQDELLQFKNNIRSKLWTIEILTNHINDIIHDFIISDFDDISSFFVSYIRKQYPGSSKRQKNFCYTFILSLIYYKQKYIYLDLYHDIFVNHKRKNFYEFLYDCKELIFQQQNQYGTSYAQLDQIYLNDKEWIYVLNQMLGLEREEIKQFRDDMSDIVVNLKRRKANYLHLQRSQQFSMYFFLQQALHYYRQVELAEKEEKLQMIEQFRQRSSVRSEQDLESSLQHEQILQKKRQQKKEQLVKKLKETIKTTNRYKSSCITLMTYLHEIDPIFLEIKKKIQTQKDLLNQIKQNKIQGKKYEEFVNKVQVGQLNFLERGSSLYSQNSKDLLKNLLNEDVEIYKTLTQRQKEKIPAVKRLIKNLRKKIFDEQFTLFKEGEGKNMDNLKKELEKIFGKFQDLKNSDYVILNTYFNNYDSNNNQELQMDNLLDKVSAKILKIVDRALDENDEIQEESLQSISRSTQKHSSKKVTFSQLDQQIEQEQSITNSQKDSNKASKLSSFIKQEESQKSYKEEDRKISFGDTNQLDQSEKMKDESSVEENVKEDSVQKEQSIQQKEESESEDKSTQKEIISEKKDMLQSKESEADDDYINRINQEVEVQHKKQSVKQDEEKQKQIDKIAEKRIPQFLQKKPSQFNVLDLPINNTFVPVKQEISEKQITQKEPPKKQSDKKIQQEQKNEDTQKSESEKRDVFDIKRSQSPPKKKKSKFQNLEKTDMNDEGDNFSHDFDLSPKPTFQQTQNFEEDVNRQSRVSFNQTADLAQIQKKDKIHQSKKSLRKSKHQQSRKSNLASSQVSRQSIQSRSSRRSKKSYMQLYEDRKSLARNQSRASIIDSRVNMRDSISPSQSNRNDKNLPVKRSIHDKPKKSMSKQSIARVSNLPPVNSMKSNLKQSKASLADQRIGSKVSLRRDNYDQKRSSKNLNQTQGTEMIDTEIDQTKRTEMINTEFGNMKQTELINSEDENEKNDNKYVNKQTEMIDTQIDKQKEDENVSQDDNKRNTLEIQTNDGNLVENELINTLSDKIDDYKKSDEQQSQEQNDHLNYSGPKQSFLKDSDKSIQEKQKVESYKSVEKSQKDSQQQDNFGINQESKKSNQKSQDSQINDQLQESSLKQIMVDSEVVDQPLENKRKESKKNSMRETGIQFKDSKYEMDYEQEENQPKKRLSTIHEQNKFDLKESQQEQSQKDVNKSNQDIDVQKQSILKESQQELSEKDKDTQKSEKHQQKSNFQESEIQEQDQNIDQLNKGTTELRKDLLQSEEQIFASDSQNSNKQELKQSSIKDNQQRISQLQQSELYAMTQSKQMKNLESIGKNVYFEEGYQNETDVNSLSSNRGNQNLQNSLLTNEKKFTNLENFDDFKQNLDQINSYNVLANDDQTIMISNPKVSTDRKQNDGNESINAIIGNLEANKDDNKFDQKIEEIPEEEDSKNILPDDSAMINDSLQQDLRSLGLSNSQYMNDSQKEKKKVPRNIQTKKGQAIAEKVGLIDSDKKSLKNYFKNIFKQFKKINEKLKKICKEYLNLEIDFSLQLQAQILQNFSKKIGFKNRKINSKLIWV